MPDADARFMRRYMPGYLAEVQMEFFVTPRGNVLECTVLYPRVSDELGAQLCEPTIGKRLGSPARGPDGERTYGMTAATIVRSTRSESPSERDGNFVPSPDLVISVSTMPGEKERHTVNVLVLIDEEGRIQDCESQARSEDGFAAVACEQSVGHQFAIHRGEDRVPARYVDSIRVDFVLDTAAD